MKLSSKILNLIEPSFVNEKEYEIQYVLKNPPPYAKKYPEIWKQALTEYLSRQGVNIDKIKKVDNIEWNEVIRIFNTLLGVKNRQRPDGFKKQKNKELITEDIDKAIRSHKKVIANSKAALSLMQLQANNTALSDDKRDDARESVIGWQKKIKEQEAKLQYLMVKKQNKD